MATITIDQKAYEITEEKNLLETALSLGLDLPYFCWHPALGSVGACRQCAVIQYADEKDTTGRLTMACMTSVKNGMCFSINHETASGFRKQVIEWLMINHPHDCPVCDEGGECHLQDMTLMTGHNYRRHRFSKRTFNNQNLGPFINHEMNRCITCYRCVRFYKDVAGGDDLSAFASSGRVYFGRAQDGALESSFSGNLAEVCPTGVFTDKVYHQRYVRKWDLETAPSICQMCSLGCSISPGARVNVLRRVQNRFHEDVNGYFICDAGRFGHDFVNATLRTKTPWQKKDSDRETLSFDDAKSTVKSLLKNNKNIVGIGSSRASLEANFLLKQIVGADHFYDGLPVFRSDFNKEALHALEAGAVDPASLKDIRQADCVVILGEDVAATAPMMELSIRQANIEFKKQKSGTDLNISPWNDAAVRGYVRADLLPVFVAHSHETSIAELGEQCIVHPHDLLKLSEALSAALAGEQPQDLDAVQAAFVKNAAQALSAAKRPVIIVGGSAYAKGVLSCAANMVTGLLVGGQRKAKLAMVFADANSLGLSLLKPKPATELAAKEMIDVAVVVENDLQFNLGDEQFNQLLGKVKHLVVIDSLHTPTVDRATVLLPSLSFAESTASLLNNEARLQRYYAVFKNLNPSLESSFHVLASLSIVAGHMETLDDVSNAIAQHMPKIAPAIAAFRKANFTLLERGLPRQTTEYSGRTALNANISMHEQAPPKDKDSFFTFTMEGSRKKTPLPLVSSYWEPKWNSVQASFKKELLAFAKHEHVGEGERIFAKTNHTLLATASKAKKPTATFPQLYILPRFQLFASQEYAHYAAAVAPKMPQKYAFISSMDAKAHGIVSDSEIEFMHQGVCHQMKVQIINSPQGTMMLPFGLVDASLFYNLVSVKKSAEAVL